MFDVRAILAVFVVAMFGFLAYSVTVSDKGAECEISMLQGSSVGCK